MKVKYFQDGERFIAVTSESPKDFPKILFIGKQGTDPLKIEEAVFAPEQVRGLREITLKDMPAVWTLAFGYERPTAPKPKPEPVEEFPLFDPESGDLLDYIPIRRNRRPTCGKPDRRPFDTGLIIGIIIGLLCIALGFI